MMLLGPILIALLPVVIILEITRWLIRNEFPFSVTLTPGVVSIMIAITLFYSGFVNLKGFGGLSYGILALFLIMTGFKSLFIRRTISYSRYI